jgi:protoporphyrinogen oxidase
MKIGIAGAGATGLTAAYELAKAGHEVTILEAADYKGGLVGTVRVGELDIERFYHHIFTSDTYVIDTIEEMGLSDKLKWISPRSGIYSSKRLFPFSTPMDLLRFNVIPFIERVRLGMLVLYARSINNWAHLEKVTAKDWVTKLAGKNAYEKFWGPLLNSKFDTNANDVAAVWIWNKFKLRGSTRGKDTSSEMFGYLSGSFGQIYKRLTEEIIKRNGQINYACRVSRISKAEDGSIAIESSTGNYHFDKFIFTGSPGLLSNLCTEFTPEYAKKLNGIKYKGNICVLMELEKPLSDYYWITIAENGAPFVLVIEHTNLVKDPLYQSHVAYLSRYLDAENPVFSYTDEELKTLFYNYLKEIFPHFKEADVKKILISRTKFAQPVVMLNYSDSIPPLSTSVEGLYLASMAQIYPEDRGQNYSYRMGKEVAKLCIQDKDQ